MENSLAGTVYLSAVGGNVDVIYADDDADDALLDDASSNDTNNHIHNIMDDPMMYSLNDVVSHSALPYGSKIVDSVGYHNTEHYDNTKHYNMEHYTEYYQDSPLISPTNSIFIQPQPRDTRQIKILIGVFITLLLTQCVAVVMAENPITWISAWLMVCIFTGIIAFLIKLLHEKPQLPYGGV